ncbi:MAG: MBL fold metallo-hydrolase [Bacteroidales bacterium]|nr:MBL fold metallo-hydrolase [Bacteroidales bacterium]
MEIFRLIFSSFQENTYILKDKSGDCAIIDCGCYDKTEFAELVNLIESENMNPVLLLNTHCHLDHVFGNRFVLEKYNLRTLCHESDEFNRINSPQDAILFGLTMDTSPEPGGFISESNVLKFGTTELAALEVPGHTSGSLAFYSEKNNCVFSGDALFAGNIGRTDLPGGDYDTLIKSIRQKLFVLPQSTIVYPGHGNATTIGDEIRSNHCFIFI